MKINGWILLGAVMVGLPTVAAPVSPDAARMTAQRQLQRRHGTAQRQMPAQTELWLAYEAKSANGAQTDYYVFNRGADGGYVIVAGDDRATPVLGYSDNGTFDLASLPDNAKWWIEQLQREVRYVRVNPRLTARPAVNLGREVPPLITCVWNQAEPYNNLCPMWGNYRCYTGCVATALAQIMYYHKWPERGTGTVTYTTTINRVLVELSRDFTQSEYEWGRMTDIYQDGSDAATQDAVARLMLDVGIATRMGYSPVASGTYSGYAADALRSHFGYSQALALRLRDMTPIAQWEQMLRDELDARRPVYYSGNTATGGHAFVLDGYDSDGLFHFNWGWGGKSNGFFAITALNPSEQGIGSYDGGYNSCQMAIVGIRPDDGAPLAHEVYGYYESFTPGRERMARGDVAEFALSSFGIVASDEVEVQARLGLSLYDTAGHLVTTTVPDADSEERVIGATYITSTLGLPLGNDLAEGAYLVRPSFAYGEVEQTDFTSPLYHPGYVRMTVTSDSAYFTLPAIETNLSLDSVTMACDEFYTNRPIPMTLWMSNRAETEYFGDLQLVMMQGDSVLERNVLGIDIPAGGQRAVNTQLMAGTKAGDYAVGILDADGNRLGDLVELRVKKAGNYLLNIVQSIAPLANEMPAGAVRATATVTNTGAPFLGRLEMLVLDSAATVTLATAQSRFLTLKKGVQEQVEFKASFAGEPGRTYQLALRNPGVTGSYRVWGDTVPFVVSMPAVPGDVNGDGVADVADVNILINIILGQDIADNYAGRAYVNGDDVVDVADVNAVINVILGN